MKSVDTRLIAFRCPVELLEKMDLLAAAVQSNRTAVILESIRLLARQARKRGGHLVPPYTNAIMAEMSFAPRPRKPRVYKRGKGKGRRRRKTSTQGDAS